MDGQHRPCRPQLVEAFLGVKAEGQSLESIAQPLTAEDEPGPDAGPTNTTATQTA